MSDTWSDLQAFKSKQSSLREKLKRRRKERQEVLAGSSVATPAPDVPIKSEVGTSGSADVKPGLDVKPTKASLVKLEALGISKIEPDTTPEPEKVDPELLAEVEKRLIAHLNDITLELPADAAHLMFNVDKNIQKSVPLSLFEDVLQKFAAQELVSLSIKEDVKPGLSKFTINTIDFGKLSAMLDLVGNPDVTKKRKAEEDDDLEEVPAKQAKKVEPEKQDDIIEDLLSMGSAKEKENKKINEEILQLLSKPTAKEQSLVEKFKSQGGSLQEFCQFGTREECFRQNTDPEAAKACDKLHFRKIINQHTDENLGDCSFLNTCFHMDTCKYVHYEIDYPEQQAKVAKTDVVMKKTAMKEEDTILLPPQWVQCDVRQLDASVLGKFAVIMADPPWDIHMELPYGTMSDDEMRKLAIPALQDEGYIFLWVTGRAMELGRECLRLWGYERVDELIWVKTNQLQRIIRTGRTGHWFNHGKEHCLVGVKGNQKANRGLDCDVIVAEVRATSHKPDEIYGIIERLSPGTKKVELFGRMHNVQPNWVTLGNQLDGVKLVDPEVVRAFKIRYPDGNITAPS